MWFCPYPVWNKGQEAAPRFEPAQQGIERFAVGSARTDKARIRRHAKRLFFQPIEFQEHKSRYFRFANARGNPVTGTVATDRPPESWDGWSRKSSLLSA